MINVADVRIKCLQLAHRPDLLPQDVVERAKVYEAFIQGEAKADNSDKPTRGPGRPPGKTGKC